VDAESRARPDATRGTSLIGTPAYMAPEQVRGSGPVDARADLYALGVMLFQMLTGRLPFTAASAMETALARLYEPPADPLSLRPALPRALAAVLQRALAREADDRFQTADELATALSGERPAGPDLAEYLRARAVTARRGMTAAARWSLNRQMADEATLGPTLDDESVRTPAVPPLPHPHPEPSGRELKVTVLLLRFRGAAEDEYLAHGLTEEIIDRLSESEGLLVTSVNVVRSLTDAERTPAALGEKLRTQVILDGTLQVSPTGLLATVRLCEVERGLQFAVRRFERADRNVLALAAEAAHALAGLLSVQLDQSQCDIASDTVAVDLYMQARHRYQSLNNADAAQSVALFEMALARLPEDPTLLSGYARSLARLWFFAGHGAGERATRAAERAVQISPERSESLLALATVQLNANRVVDAAGTLRRVLVSAQRLAEAHELVGHLLSETGPMDLALRHLNCATLLDSAVPRARFSAARVHALEGRPEAALSALIFSSNDASYSFGRWVGTTRVLGWFRDRERARAYLDDPDLNRPENQQARKNIAFIAGQCELTREEFVPAIFRGTTTSPRGYMFGLQLSIEYYCHRQQLAEAMQTLLELNRYTLVDIEWLDYCPLLAELRRAPEFPAVRARVAEAARLVRRALGIHEG
jgi:serine/threonine-protein kinase